MTDDAALSSPSRTVVVRAHGFAVATRNVQHFGDTGVELIDPWQSH